MSDYASDFGTYVVCCRLSEEEAISALVSYFDRKPDYAELRHNLAYVGLAGWCWYVWSLVKEAQGDFVGEWLYVYYDYAVRYIDKALSLYSVDFGTPTGARERRRAVRRALPSVFSSRVQTETSAEVRGAEADGDGLERVCELRRGKAR